MQTKNGMRWMRKSLMMLTWLTALSVLASCGPRIEAGCAGWRQVQVAGATVDYLAEQDPQALRALIGHQEFGMAAGCWP
ncbi:hypothetical protein EIO_1253 [Ketogulonicigenium vulgare Y25]|uniref:Lipoprotein n=1 Tax=Ketogulonicigenium vulgare (strain WSH-001) TaxID=759362 RepID=F9Y4N6_KETVW|nr:hypothetical protein EIO_1253 [Ketogulonicigenium vulgare Y25]AEM40593.1 hypothetical protein KVU_0754 [Ketogulonicigenium vulgare WSH-001]ALJ82292.1 hypothetical protein KVH_06005 [Ketogulonicigenium vulgare]ANW34984.1 hypothetical protein KvSKV_05975 [Ketogulonicigenium vulgare]